MEYTLRPGNAPETLRMPHHKNAINVTISGRPTVTWATLCKVGSYTYAASIIRYDKGPQLQLVDDRVLRFYRPRAQNCAKVRLES